MNRRRASPILHNRFSDRLARYSNYPIGTVSRINSYCKRRFRVAFGFKGNPHPIIASFELGDGLVLRLREAGGSRDTVFAISAESKGAINERGTNRTEEL